MSRLIDSVDQRTNLVGENRLELLLFRLGGHQVFAINVFKVQEVIKLPRLTPMPHSQGQVMGLAQWRDQAVPVVDLSRAIGVKAPPRDADANLIMTEYNRSTQGFFTGAVDRIVNLNWHEVMAPPDGVGRRHYLTAITQLDEQIVEIIDVERVLADIVPLQSQPGGEQIDAELVSRARERGIKVLLAEDSATAVNQVRETLSGLGLELIAVPDGRKALDTLKAWAAEGRDVNRELLMLITDAEMPEMDGYRLTSEIRADPALRQLHVVLHTSLSGHFNEAMVKKVGCDQFLSKFAPSELADLVLARLRDYLDAESG